MKRHDLFEQLQQKEKDYMMLEAKCESLEKDVKQKGEDLQSLKEKSKDERT